MFLDISRAGDPTGSFFVPSVAVQDSTDEERCRRAIAPQVPGLLAWAAWEIFHNIYYATFTCRRNIEMTPRCKIEVTLLRVLGSRELRGGGVIDEQAGVQPS
jgi:hypothetical protein